jgi:hypothetical protein
MAASVPGNRKSWMTDETYSPEPPTSSATPSCARISSIFARASRWYAATDASSVTSSTSRR